MLLQVTTLEFDRNRKMMSTLCTNKGRAVLFAKGAPESVLARCSQVTFPHLTSQNAICTLLVSVMKAASICETRLEQSDNLVSRSSTKHTMRPHRCGCSMLAIGIIEKSVPRISPFSLFSLRRLDAHAPSCPATGAKCASLGFLSMLHLWFQPQV